MAAEGGGYPKKPGIKGIHALLDFGPEAPAPVVPAAGTPPHAGDVTMRLRTIVKAIEDISRRIDRLNERF